MKCYAAALAAIVATCVPALAAPTPLTPLGPGFNSSAYSGQLQSTVFATGLSNPTSMQSYAGGLLVATSTGGYIAGGTTTGHLTLFTDTDNNGIADTQADLTPAGGLPGGVTSVRQAGSLIFVTSAFAPTEPIISILKPGATPTSPLVSVGQIGLTFTDADWLHRSFALATRPTPSQAGSYDVFFNLGGRKGDSSDAGNFATHHATANTSGNATGLTNVTLNPESIYKTTVSFNGTTASLSAPVQVAGGLRNSAGIAIHPTSGDLYFQDNGMDGDTNNGHPPDKYGNAAYSLDTLHKINAANIGVSFPSSNFTTDFYENTRPVATVHGTPDAIAHFDAFGPFDPADQNSSPNESEGPNEITIAPSNFPAGLNNGVFLGFHGQFDKFGPPNTTTGAGNEEAPVVFYNFDTGTYWHFIGTNEPNVGHLDGLLATQNTLYLSDLADGDVFTGPFTNGTIYAITVVPEPTSTALLALSAGLLTRRGRRR